MDQAIDRSQLRSTARFVTQEPLHAAAVESMRRRHSETRATKDDTERVVASSSGALQFEFNVTAGWFDYQHHGRQWILDERVDPRTRRVAHPVDLRCFAQPAQDRGFVVRQPADRARHLGIDVAGLVHVEISYTVRDPDVSDNPIDDFFRREQVTRESQLALAA